MTPELKRIENLVNAQIESAKRSQIINGLDEVAVSFYEGYELAMAQVLDEIQVQSDLDKECENLSKFDKAAKETISFVNKVETYKDVLKAKMESAKRQAQGDGTPWSGDSYSDSEAVAYQDAYEGLKKILDDINKD